MSALDTWRSLVIPLGKVPLSAPSWVVPGLLVPGLNLFVGAPKTFKSTMMLLVCGMVVGRKMPSGLSNNAKVKLPPSKGTVVYVAYEQSARRLRYHYEKRVLAGKPLDPRSMDLLLVKDPWLWRVDEPDATHDLKGLMQDLKPTVTILDPWSMAHSQDENDVRSVLPLAELKDVAARQDSALVVVHHARKGSSQSDNNGKNADAGSAFDRARGTSALWAMADAGHIFERRGDFVHIESNFKDFVGGAWGWKPPR